MVKKIGQKIAINHAASKLFVNASFPIVLNDFFTVDHGQPTSCDDPLIVLRGSDSTNDFNTSS
jgi:hypothetical protein